MSGKFDRHVLKDFRWLILSMVQESGQSAGISLTVTLDSFYAAAYAPTCLSVKYPWSLTQQGFVMIPVCSNTTKGHSPWTLFTTLISLLLWFTTLPLSWSFSISGIISYDLDHLFLYSRSLVLLGPLNPLFSPIIFISLSTASYISWFLLLA